MNYLAHSLLSSGFDDIMIGNFIADSIKGTDKIETLRIGIREGVFLHRKIDHFTDSHPAFVRSRKRLLPHHGHYSAVIVDIIYDHFLASDFDQYSEIDLISFTQKVYALLFSNKTILPERIQTILPYMQRDNWLLNYGNMEGLDRALNGLSGRARFPNRMNVAIDDLLGHYEEFRTDFHDCFTDLYKFTQRLLLKRKTGIEL